jgi:hypothetical protein
MMARRAWIVVSLAIVCAVSGLACQPPARKIAWQEFVSTEDGFAAKFPGPVEVNTEDGSRNYLARYPGGEDFLGIRVWDMRNATDDPVGQMKDVATTYAQRKGATPLDLRELQVVGKPAIEFRLSFTAENGDVVDLLTRFVRVDQRLYELRAAYEPATGREKSIQTFFDSFQLR